MKLQNAIAFEKQLQSDQLARSFLLVSPCSYEKRLWAEMVIDAWKKKEPQLEVVRLSAKEITPAQIQQEIQTPSFWGGVRVVIVDEVDKACPISTPSDVVLILLATKLAAGLYKEEMSLLDVSGEKPWDRDRRVQEWVKARVRKEGKEMASDAIAELMALLGTDFATLDQELKKLATYVGIKKLIDLRDVEAICGSRDLSTGWQLAETLIWKGPVGLQEKMRDLAFVFPFLGQLRYHLQLGAQLAEVLEKKMDPAAYLPSIRPQNITKFAPIAKKRGLSFFLQGLLNLYELEFAAKSSSVDLGVMFDIFQGKLYETTHSTS